MDFVCPLFKKLEDSKNVLLCGCGGGFDFMNGLPLYYNLVKQKKNVVLGNLSFVPINAVSREKEFNISKTCYEVTHKTKKKESNSNFVGYFPEVNFCKFMKEEKGKEVSVFMFDRYSSVKELELDYTKLCDKFKIDTIIVVDGGNDSIMRGDEENMGSIEEDVLTMTSVFRVKNVKQDRKFLLSIGFGIDYFHGVEAAHVLQNMSHLIKNTKEGYLGCFSVLKEQEEFKFFKEGLLYVQKQMNFVSIVGSSIVASIDGEFGDHHSTYRTKGSKLFINPLMSIYWVFSIDKLTKQIHFVKKLIAGKDDELVSFDIGDHLMNYRREAREKKKIRKIEKYPH